jgi:aryl-alcohol dehydrogenase-like predicted oxidoreductase
VDALAAANVPIDISTRPILWGGTIRAKDRTFLARGTADYERATEHAHAMDLVQSHLIETLSCIGREMIDFYLLPIRRATEEFQISGALEALESARQDGHIRFLGLMAEGPSLATLATWQFHDAFEVIGIQQTRLDDTESLVPLAKDRRVGIIEFGSNPMSFGQVRVAPVRSAGDVLSAVQS